MHPHRSYRILGGTLAAFVAGSHLFHPRLGLPRLLTHVRLGTLFDPRPMTFTLSGVAMIAGIGLVYKGLLVRWIYLAGMALVLSFLLGFLAWHTVLDHGGFWPYIEAHGHVGSVDAFVRIHLIEDLTILLSRLGELALFVVLVVVYRVDVVETTGA